MYGPHLETHIWVRAVTPSPPHPDTPTPSVTPTPPVTPTPCYPRHPDTPSPTHPPSPPHSPHPVTRSDSQARQTNKDQRQSNYKWLCWISLTKTKLLLVKTNDVWLRGHFLLAVSCHGFHFVKHSFPLTLVSLLMYIFCLCTCWRLKRRRRSGALLNVAETRGGASPSAAGLCSLPLPVDLLFSHS